MNKMNLEKHIDAGTAVYQATYNKLDKWQREKTAEGEQVKQNSYRLTQKAASEENDAFIAKYNGLLEAIISEHKTELEKVKAAYLQEVEDFYRPDGDAIDQADKTLLDSGILTAKEFSEMVIKHRENPTMLRIMENKNPFSDDELEIGIRKALLLATKKGEKEKMVLHSFEQLLDAPIKMAQQGLAGTETFMKTALKADEYAEQKKAELIRARLYLSEEDEKALQDYSDKENQRQNERNKGMDWRN